MSAAQWLKVDGTTKRSSCKVGKQTVRLWKEEMLTFHTRTLTFLSSYDISSHPKTMQLITGFIVSGAGTIYKLVVYKTLTHSPWLAPRIDVKSCRHSRVSEDGGGDLRGEIGEEARLLFWLAKSMGCVYVWVFLRCFLMATIESLQWLGTFGSDGSDQSYRTVIYNKHGKRLFLVSFDQEVL